jgi:hypothetical protein
VNVALSQNKRRLRDVLCLTFSDSVLREGVKKNKKSGEPKKKRASLLSEGEVNTKTCTGYTMLMRVDIAERACGKCIAMQPSLPFLPLTSIPRSSMSVRTEFSSVSHTSMSFIPGLTQSLMYLRTSLCTSAQGCRHSQGVTDWLCGPYQLSSIGFLLQNNAVKGANPGCIRLVTWTNWLSSGVGQQSSDLSIGNHPDGFYRDGFYRNRRQH